MEFAGKYARLWALKVKTVSSYLNQLNSVFTC